ncbi:MAG: Protein kinase protein [Actinobacteria bacterium]|nr:Protein kinase protein [Actinomycetota bacterium]
MDEASDKEEMPPVRIGKYAVIRKIASGGMAEVYLCRLRGDEGFEKKVAVKVIHPRLGEDRRFRDLFAHEARIAASLIHPNLIQVFDFGREGQSCFLVMEFVDGWNLAQAMSQARMRSIPIPLPVWRYWMEGILAGLGHLHTKGIVHRDISPSNVLLSRGGTVKITDFGIARGALQGMDANGGLEGKFSYMSPEQARGGGSDAGSDLFAAAVIAAEFYLPGRLFGGGSAEEILSHLRRYDSRELDLGGLPPEIQEVAGKGLSTDGKERFTDADEFARAVCAAVASPPGRAELQSFWSVLFPDGAGEEDTAIANNISADRKDMVRESRGAYGGKNKRLVKVGILAALAAFSAGGWIALRETGKPAGTGTQPVSAPAPAAAHSRSAGSTSARGSESTPAVAVEPPRKLAGQAVAGKRHDAPHHPSSEIVSPSSPVIPQPARVPEAISREVLVETDPAGVAVALDDGTPLGRTPVRLDLGPWEGRKIVFQKEGYTGKSVQSDAIARFKIFRLEMDRQVGTIEVVQAIPWAKVYDGDRYLGDTPIQDLKLPVGKRRLRFVNEPLAIEIVHEIIVQPGANPRLIVPLVGKSRTAD